MQVKELPDGVQIPLFWHGFDEHGFGCAKTWAQNNAKTKKINDFIFFFQNGMLFDWLIDWFVVLCCCLFVVVVVIILKKKKRKRKKKRKVNKKKTNL